MDESNWCHRTGCVGNGAPEASQNSCTRWFLRAPGFFGTTSFHLATLQPRLVSHKVFSLQLHSASPASSFCCFWFARFSPVSHVGFFLGFRREALQQGLRSADPGSLAVSHAHLGIWLRGPWEAETTPLFGIPRGWGEYRFLARSWLVLNMIILVGMRIHSSGGRGGFS